MTINFIPNDPLVSSLAMRTEEPRPDRLADQAGFEVAGVQPADIYAPGTPGFLRWQSRQAALRAVLAWSEILGEPVASWAEGAADPHRLPLLPDTGDDLNAYYDRESVSFFHHRIGADTVFSGASTDVVAHEVGHAILDAIRPSLWASNYLETGGYHEAFGDITAVLTALADDQTRAALLAENPDIARTNEVEATAEQLSDAIRMVAGPAHPASKPRHAFNTFQWQLPSTMPTQGGPDDMIAEVHSIARIMSGVFYDLLSAIYTASGDGGEGASLWKAATVAGRLIHHASRTAPQTPRFFQSVGRSMVLADEQLNAGANRELIKQAFLRHGIALGTAAMTAPVVALAGQAPTADLATGRAAIDGPTGEDLRQRLDVPPGTPITVSAVDLAGGLVKAAYRERVPLDDVDPRLSGVFAFADVQVLVGESGSRAAVLGALPRPDDQARAVHTFAASLAATGQIAYDEATSRQTTAEEAQPTHRIVTRDGSSLLERIRFT
jgi:hypothetical protein